MAALAVPATENDRGARVLGVKTSVRNKITEDLSLVERDRHISVIFAPCVQSLMRQRWMSQQSDDEGAKMKKSMRKLTKNFLRKSDGNMSIEFVIMLPLFVVMLSGAVDLSKVYIDQSNAYSVARDTARLVARHAMDEDAAEAYAKARVATFTSGEPSATVNIQNSRVSVTVSAPNAVMAKLGFVKSLKGTSTTATVTHTMEPV